MGLFKRFSENCADFIDSLPVPGNHFDGGAFQGTR